VEAWTLRVSKADGLLVETNTINHLQLGTQVMVLQNVRFLKRLDPHDPRLRSLVMHCPTQEFWQKQNIIEQGSSGDTFYILMEGTVQVQVDGKVVATQAADIDHGQVYYFGEVAALQQKVAKRNATVRVTSKAANVLCVSSGNIDETFGSLESLLEEEGTTLKEVLGDQMIEKKVHKSKKKGDVPTSEDLSEQIRKQSLASATHESVLKPIKKGKKAAEEDDDDEQMQEYKKMFKKCHEKELEAKNAKAKAKGKAGSSHQVKLAMVT
jgi:CRP-like cAMP-binding protein